MKYRSLMVPFVCLVAAVIGTAAAAAPKVVGTCKVEVQGPHPVVIAGKLYEGDVPEGTIQSMGSSAAWGKKQLEIDAKKSKDLAKFTSMIHESAILTLACVSDKGQALLSPADGAEADKKNFPAGPKVYRLVNPSTYGRKPTDMGASVINRDPSTPAPLLEPVEPGELKVTRNDEEKLVATFSFRAGKLTTVTGSFDFTRPAMNN